jgi:hypothetical protein
MKKFIILFLIFLCLFFNIIGLNPTFAVAATFKEGIYTIADFNASPGKVYTIKNVSKTNSVRVFIYDEDYMEMQNMKLEPDSTEIDTIPIQANYILIIAGDGEVTITPKSP